MILVDETRALLNASPEMAAVLKLPDFGDFPGLIGGLLGRICQNPQIGEVVRRVYATYPHLVEVTAYDIAQTAARNFEPGGAPATLLFARGAQAVIGHRVAHQLWEDGDVNLSLALKSAFGRAFSTDMHPAARIGAGFWLDHGLGFVIGETSTIDEDVSIWHNVTMGGTLNDDGPNRHPRIGRGAVIGAGAMLLGDIHIGEEANVAAGAIVLEDVPAGKRAVGTKARILGDARVRFAPTRAGT